MGKFIFKYGAMKSGKSMDLIKTKINYDRGNRAVLVLKPSIDTRDGDKITTRLGKSIDVTLLNGQEGEIFSILEEKSNDGVDIRAILIDEAQFLNQEQVLELGAIVDVFNISVICYGLKTNFKGRLFEGSKALLEIVDKIEEIKTICQFCERKAIMNLKMAKDKNGKLIKARDGDEISIGDDEYIQVCRDHFFE